MAYTAAGDITHPGSPWFHIFRDGSPSIPFLQAYIDHGGRVNTVEDGGYGTNSLLNATFNNLAGRVFLLEHGADGWLVDRPSERLRFASTTFGSRVWGARAADASEELYLLVQRGLFQMTDNPVYAPMVHDTYLNILEEMADASGPTARHELWAVQKVVGALIAKGHLVPSARMQTLLRDNAIPDAEGGWIRSAGQLHQAFDDPRVGAVLGTEIW